MSEKISTQFNTSNISNQQYNILDFIQLKSFVKEKDFTTLELNNGSIISFVGNSINLLNELTIVATAQNFSLYLKKNNFNKNVFISHDGSLQGILFSKVFASSLISENINAYFNFENKPLNNAMSIYVAKKNKINFGHIVTFSNNIQKNLHQISFFNNLGLLLNSSQSKEINALISETNFLNLKAPNEVVPTISFDEITNYNKNELKSKYDLSNLNVLFSNHFKLNNETLKILCEENNLNYKFINWKKNPTKENQVTRKSLILSTWSDKELIINFTSSINNCEFIIKHKKRWKYLSLNDLAIIYLYYKKMTSKIKKDKNIFYSQSSSRYISYFAKKYQIPSEKFISLIDSIDQKISSNVLLATNGTNYFVCENNPNLCSDPILNIKLLLEMASFFKKQNKNLYQVLTDIYKENGIFHFNSKIEKLDIENVNIFFNRIQKQSEINGTKIIKIDKSDTSPMNVEITLNDKTIINFEYFKNINQLVSSISIWDNKIEDNNSKEEDKFVDLIVKEKNIMNEFDSLKETFNVGKFSWQGLVKYSIFVILFIILFYLMFTFILGGDRNLWPNVINFLKQQKDFAYLIPVLISSIFLFNVLLCSIDKIILKKLNENVKLRHLWIANSMALCISYITPLIYGGEGVGYWYLRRKGLSNSSIASIFLIKSLFTQINFIIFFLIFAPIGFIKFFGDILNGPEGVVVIVLIVIGIVLDIFSAIMISLLTFSSRLTSSLAKLINKFIEWIPFIVSKKANERGSQLKYEFTNINKATKKIFYGDRTYKNIFIFLEILFLTLFLKFIDLNGIMAIIGNFLPNPSFMSYIEILSGNTLIRGINAINFIIPSGIGISDWASKNILFPIFNKNDPSYSIEVFQTLSRILFTFLVIIISSLILLTVFIGESRVDKYNKIKKTLTREEIENGHIRIKTRFYSFALIPWTIGIIGAILAWNLIYIFVIVPS